MVINLWGPFRLSWNCPSDGDLCVVVYRCRHSGIIPIREWGKRLTRGRSWVDSVGAKALASPTEPLELWGSFCVAWIYAKEARSQYPTLITIRCGLSSGRGIPWVSQLPLAAGKAWKGTQLWALRANIPRIWGNEFLGSGMEGEGGRIWTIHTDPLQGPLLKRSLNERSFFPVI